MVSKERKLIEELFNNKVITIGAIGLLLEGFKKIMDDAKVQTAKELLEEAMKKLEVNE